MEVRHKKNTIKYLAIPMIDTANPETFLTGETVADTAYYKDGAGSWTSLSITDTFSEIGSTGMYEIDLTAAEMNHDQVLIKLTSSGTADSMVLFQMFTQDIDDFNITSSGNIGIDWANVENPTTSLDLSGTDIQLCDTITTLTGHTAQTGDTYALANGSAGFVAIDTVVDAILVDTAEIGAAGAGLTDLGGMSTAMKAEVNAECDTAISDAGLTAAGIADAVWDEDIVAAHTTTDTAGKILASTTNLAIGSGGISITQDSFTKTQGGTETNDETSTEALDGTVHLIPANGTPEIDVYYEFDVGVTGVATEIIFDGYVQSNNDNVEVYGYDWGATAYVQVGTIAGTSGATMHERIFIFTSNFTGTGTDVGKVRCRFHSDGADVATNLGVDRILCEYTALLGAGTFLHTGVAQAGTTNTITLDSSANATDDFYNHARVVISSGTGAEQERIIVDYIGSTKVATIAPPWVTSPDSTSAFEVEPALAHAETGWATIKVGLVAAATSTTITLDSIASAVDDYYNGDLAHIDAGTGDGQTRYITDYNGTTKVATIDPAWTTTPDTTSEYIIEEAHPYIDALVSSASAPTAAAVADAVWDEATSGHQSVGTAGRALTIAGTILAETVLTGTPTTTTMQLTAGSATDDFYNDMELVIVDGTYAGLARIITDYTGSTKLVTFDEALTGAPSSGDAVIVRANHKHSKTQIADTVRAEMDSNSTQLAAIVADTNELQTDDVPGLIAALNDVSAADVNAQCDTAISDAALATAANLATVDGIVDDILTDTGTTLPATLSGLNDISVADLLTTQMTESYAANGVAPTLAQALFAIHQFGMQQGIAGTAWTVKKLDNSTTAFVVTLDDATDPTSAERV